MDSTKTPALNQLIARDLRNAYADEGMKQLVNATTDPTYMRALLTDNPIPNGNASLINNPADPNLAAKAAEALFKGDDQNMSRPDFTRARSNSLPQQLTPRDVRRLLGVHDRRRRSKQIHGQDYASSQLTASESDDDLDVASDTASETSVECKRTNEGGRHHHASPRKHKRHHRRPKQREKDDEDVETESDGRHRGKHRHHSHHHQSRDTDEESDSDLSGDDHRRSHRHHKHKHSHRHRRHSFDDDDDARRLRHALRRAEHEQKHGDTVQTLELDKVRNSPRGVVPMRIRTRSLHDSGSSRSSLTSPGSVHEHSHRSRHASPTVQTAVRPLKYQPMQDGSDWPLLSRSIPVVDKDNVDAIDSGMLLTDPKFARKRAQSHSHSHLPSWLQGPPEYTHRRPNDVVPSVPFSAEALSRKNMRRMNYLMPSTLIWDPENPKQNTMKVRPPSSIEIVLQKRTPELDKLRSQLGIKPGQWPVEPSGIHFLNRRLAKEPIRRFRELINQELIRYESGW